MKSNIPTQWINLIRQKPNLFMPYQSGSQQLVYYQENGVDIGTIYQKYYRGITSNIINYAINDSLYYFIQSIVIND